LSNDQALEIIATAYGRYIPLYGTIENPMQVMGLYANVSPKEDRKSTIETASRTWAAVKSCWSSAYVNGMLRRLIFEHYPHDQRRAVDNVLVEWLLSACGNQKLTESTQNRVLIHRIEATLGEVYQRAWFCTVAYWILHKKISGDKAVFKQKTGKQLTVKLYSAQHPLNNIFSLLEKLTINYNRLPFSAFSQSICGNFV
jgi:hypothetical protein